MKPESLIITSQPYDGKFILQPYTHNPSHKELVMPEVVTLTTRREMPNTRLMKVELNHLVRES